MDTILHVRVNPDLLVLVRHYCLDNRMKLKDFVEQALSTRLDGLQPLRYTESMNRIIEKEKAVKELKVVKDEFSQE